MTDSSYNVEKEITKCITSILNQTEQDFEIILINDGSTDHSKQICEKFKKKYSNKITLINQENKGLSIARNEGLHIAKGDYILFIDSDDYVEPYMLSEISKKLDLNPDMIGFHHKIIGEHDGKIHSLDIKQGITCSGQEHLMKCLQQSGLFIMVWKYAYKKTFLNKYNLTFHNGIIHEDEEWTIKTLCLAKTCIFLNKELYIYNKHSGSVSRTKSIKSIYGYIEVAKELDKFIRKMSINKNLKKMLKHRIFNFYYYNSLKIIDDNIVNDNKKILRNITNWKELLKSINLLIIIHSCNMWKNYKK